MSLFVEFHLIQNFAPSNLNRDDMGMPKDAIFGGYRRARVSSQCFKRAIRQATNVQGLIDPAFQGVRTQKLFQLLKEQLTERGRSEADSRIEAVLNAAGLKLKEDFKTEYLLFLGNTEISSLAEVIDKHWNELASVAPKGEKKSKKEAKASAPPVVVRKVKALLDGGKAVDIALFGRMLADLPEVNQDAACQVAHAISTHYVQSESDYFTAMDDKAGANESGAAMIGQVEFNSATFYRYAVIDASKLLANLKQDKDLALAAIEAFTQAIARAIPTGKQNSFAAHNPPSFVGIVVRSGEPLSLVNAFEKPITPQQDKTLTSLSVKAMSTYEVKISDVYGKRTDAWSYLDLTASWPAGKGEAQDNLDALSDWVKNAVAQRLEA